MDRDRGLTKEEAERFQKLLREKGLKLTKQRMVILRVMAMNVGHHMSAENVYERVKEQDPEIGLATVYRALQLLSDMEIISRLSFHDGFVRYEYSDKYKNHSKHHHHHLICEDCGAVLECDDDLLDTMEKKLREDLGFEVHTHEVTFFGTCHDCGEKRRKKEEEKDKADQEEGPPYRPLKE